MANIYLTHSPEAFRLYYGDRALAGLERLGTVLRNPSEDEPDGDALVAQAREADVVVAFRVPAIPADVLKRLPRTRAVCRVAVDVRNIDIPAASREGILVTHATPGFATSVSEWILGAMINLGRQVTAATLVYRAGREPEAAMGRELRNATLGLIGYGTIGRELTRLAQALGMKVQVHDPHVEITTPGVEARSLDDLLSAADFVVCMAVATPETAGLMSQAAFQRMRPDAYFINASRGELVDEAALLEALDQGGIAGCALDVGMAPDEKPSLQLARHPKVVATPHIGGLTGPAAEHQAMDTVRQVEAILSGRVPEGALNAEQAFRLKQPLP